MINDNWFRYYLFNLINYNWILIIVSTISVNYYRCIFFSQQRSYVVWYCWAGTMAALLGFCTRYFPVIKLSWPISICVFLCLLTYSITVFPYGAADRIGAVHLSVSFGMLCVLCSSMCFSSVFIGLSPCLALQLIYFV